MRKTFSAELRVEPVRCCASSIWPPRRPRLFWLSYELQQHPYLELTPKSGYVDAVLRGRVRDVAEFLSNHCVVSKSFSKFPTFMRSAPKKNGPYKPIRDP